MTRKDYILIAQVLREYIHLERNNLSCPALAIAEDLADVFHSENDRFSHKKFFEACGHG